MISQISGVIIFILMIGVPTFAQGTIDEYGNYHPTEDAIARNKRIGELLQYPTVISLRLLSQRRDGLKEEPSTTPSPYSAGQGIHFELFLTQNASENIVVPTSAWPYREYRPELIRDGDMVPYTEAAKAEVEKSEKEAPSGLMGITTLIPGREILWSYVRLEDWYKSPLKIGHYQLIVRKRFTRNGDWVESNPVTFDVIVPLTNRAQREAAELVAVGDRLVKSFEANWPKLKHEVGTPIEGSGDVALHNWRSEEMGIGVTIVRYPSEEKAGQSIKEFAHDMRSVNAVPEDAEEAYSTTGHRNSVVIRKANFLFYVAVVCKNSADESATIKEVRKLAVKATK